MGVDAVNDDAPLPLPPPLHTVQAPPECPDDDVPKQETPPASPPLRPAATPSPDPPLPPPHSGPSTRRFRSHTPQSVPPHPYAHAQDRRSRCLAKRDPVFPELPPPTQVCSTPLETVQDDVELNLPPPVEPELVAPIPSASIEDVSDDDELNLSVEEIEEELEDGHEDTRENALCAALADRADYMRSEWVTLGVHEVLDLWRSCISSKMASISYKLLLTK